MSGMTSRMLAAKRPPRKILVSTALPPWGARPLPVRADPLPPPNAIHTNPYPITHHQQNPYPITCLPHHLEGSQLTHHLPTDPVHRPDPYSHKTSAPTLTTARWQHEKRKSPIWSSACYVSQVWDTKHPKESCRRSLRLSSTRTTQQGHYWERYQTLACNTNIRTALVSMVGVWLSLLMWMKIHPRLHLLGRSRDGILSWIYTRFALSLRWYQICQVQPTPMNSSQIFVHEQLNTSSPGCPPVTLTLTSYHHPTPLILTLSNHTTNRILTQSHVPSTGANRLTICRSTSVRWHRSSPPQNISPNLWLPHDDNTRRRSRWYDRQLVTYLRCGTRNIARDPADGLWDSLPGGRHSRGITETLACNTNIRTAPVYMVGAWLSL